MEKKIYPVILSGGIGLRLWPASTESYPKQFLNINSSNSLIFDTLKRIENKIFHPPTIIGSFDHRFLIKNEIKNNNIKYRSIFLEPMQRNTMASITICTLDILKKDPNAIILALPADHIIQQKQLFLKVIKESVKIAEKNFITTFGIKPNSINTSMGYITAGKKKVYNGYLIDRFIEKPPISIAKKLTNSKKSFWNSGIFLFAAKNFVNEAENYAKQTIDLAYRVQKSIKKDMIFKVIPNKPFAKFDNEPVDKSIMEKTKNGVTVPIDIKWFDVGSWKGVLDVVKKDKNNNSINKNVFFNDVTNTIVWSKNKKVVVVGVDNLAIIEDNDAILVKKISNDEAIKPLLNKIKAIKTESRGPNQKVYRPWGEYQSIYSEKGFLIKILRIYPKNKISLQYHNKRSEHWIVVEGIATVIKGKKKFKLKQNQSTYISKGEIHRLSNETNKDLTLVEVQTGSYLEEDDIVRLEDVYGRIKKN